MDDVKTHHLSVRRTARYATLGKPHAGLQEVWFVCHGYGHLAAYFLRHFEPLRAGTRLIVAPEGLSRFYLQGFTGRVGASWMTKEDRLTEIEDYVAYLEALHKKIFAGLSENVRLCVLGFSQGTATAARWAALGSAEADRLILWAGLLPPDLDLQNHRTALQSSGVTFVVGTEDPSVDAEGLAEQQNVLERLSIPCRVVRFAGGHELNPEVLRDLSQDQDGDAVE